MNKEIKEILDSLNVVIKYEGSLELDFKECKKILDYITNLQEENKRLKACMQDTYDTANDICGELQQRINKAIEYIEKSMNNPQPFYEYITGDEDGNVKNLDKLLDILRGEE